MPQREELGQLIAGRIAETGSVSEFGVSGAIRHVAIDDLLPFDVARAIYERFPSTDRMVLKRSIREDKFIAVQMDDHDPFLEEVVFAFQQEPVVNAVAALTGLVELEPDRDLYAGGISSMVRRQVLRPHLDNSHDKERQRWRVLNLLYYVTPDWPQSDGGNLQLWPDGPKGAPITIWSRWNRLIVMETHGRSWHSVTPITGDRPRCCVSNYYFSPFPANPNDEPHVTTFRDPTSRSRDVALCLDNLLRRSARTLTGRLIRNPHVYKRG